MRSHDEIGKERAPTQPSYQCETVGLIEELVSNYKNKRADKFLTQEYESKLATKYAYILTFWLENSSRYRGAA